MPEVSRRSALKAAGIGFTAGLAGCAGQGGGGDQDQTETDGSGGGTTTGTATSGGSSGPVNVSFASGYPAGNPNYPTGLLDFKKKLEESGEFKVTLFPDAQQGSDQEVAQKVTTGSLQMGHISVSNLGPFVPRVNVKNLPLLTPTVEAGDRLLTSDPWKNMVRSQYRKKNLEPLLEWTFDFRHIGVNPGVTEKGVQTPSDFEDVKVRVAGSDITRKAFSSIGANPVGIAWAEAPSAMKEGVFDAIHISRLAHCSYKFAAFEEFVTNPNIASTMFTVFANLPWYNDLDKTQQEIIQEAAKAQRKENIKERNAALKQAEKCIEEQGANFINIGSSNRKKWVDAVGYKNSMWDSYIPKFNFTKKQVNTLAQAARK